MTPINKLNTVAIAIAFIVAAPLASANDDCTKPKIKGYSSDEMSCIGEGLVEVNSYNDAMVVNASGKTIVSKGKYIRVFQFSEGLAGVITNDYEAGFINKTGKVIIPTIYQPAMSGEGGGIVEVSPFKEGLASIAKNNNNGDEKWGFIDKTGKTIIPFKYSAAGNFGSGMAPVAIIKNDDYIWGYINKSAKTSIPFSFNYAGSFSENIAVVAKNGKYGVIDTKGKMIVPAKYEYMDNFSDGLAAVFQYGSPIKNSDSMRGKYGFIDKAGKAIIPIKYDMEYYSEISLPSFKNGKAKIEIWKNDKDVGYCINKKGIKVKC
jgi:hypothetical protein